MGHNAVWEILIKLAGESNIITSAAFFAARRFHGGEAARHSALALEKSVFRANNERNSIRSHPHLLGPAQHMERVSLLCSVRNSLHQLYTPPPPLLGAQQTPLR